MQKQNFLQKYEIVRRLGKGQFAVVYEVQERQTLQHWAAKVISKASCPASTLEAELTILQMVSHPHAVMFKEMFNTEECCIIIMELITGGELFDRISEQGAFTEKHAAKFFRELLLVVKHLHDQKIVHRDIKPENILLSDKTENAVLKVIDFGISKIAPNDKAILGLVGTLPYMAPEMFSRSSYGRPVDMWALGVVLYIILAGLFPYDPEEKKFDCPFLSPEFDEISASAKDILLKLLDKNPDTRHTVDQALRHPWVTGEQALDLSVSVENLKQNFVAKKKFKRAAETIRSGLRLRGIVMKRKGDSNLNKAVSAEVKEKEKPVALHEAINKVTSDLGEAEKLLKSVIEQMATIAKSGNLPEGIKNDFGGVEKKLEEVTHDVRTQYAQLKLWQTDLNAQSK